MGQSAHDYGESSIRPATFENITGTQLMRATIEHQAVDRRFDTMAQLEFFKDFFYGAFDDAITYAQVRSISIILSLLA